MLYFKKIHIEIEKEIFKSNLNNCLKKQFLMQFLMLAKYQFLFIYFFPELLELSFP